MPDLSLLALFIPTFFFISITPGMCMSLAMTLGMSIGVRKTLWMMYGEIVGVALVAFLSVLGIAKIMMQNPTLFLIFKIVGAIYLIYLGIKMINTKVHLNPGNTNEHGAYTKSKLAGIGFITAVANPKGWAFMIALLPPFINFDNFLLPQLSLLIIIIMVSEFICMLIYANGGKGLKRLLNKNNKSQWINRIGGGLLILVGIWLAFS